MKRFHSLLLPLDGSLHAAKAIGCALWLRERLGARLHVLHAGPQPLPDQDALSRLHIPQTEGAHVILHQLAGQADQAVLQAIHTYGADLVVMATRGESASAKLKLSQRLGSIAQAVIEQSPVPVLLLPLHYREHLPWTSMLAAASGEQAADRALEKATHLAAALKLKVTVIHAGNGPAPAGARPLGDYVDAAHHEYPGRVQEMVERGLTGCTPEESHCVDQALVRQGNAATVLLDQIKRQSCNVLALGWHGTLGTGHALVLKRLLEEAECALLLVRATEKSGARLKIGADIDGRIF